MMRGLWGAALIAVLSVRSAAQQPADTVPASAVPDPVATVVDLREGWLPDLHASPLLPFDHWAVQAARRAEAMGLTRFFPAQRAAPRTAVARALEEAARNARTPALQQLTAGWITRFGDEFGEYERYRRLGPLTLLGGSAAAGYDRATGRLAPVAGYQGLGARPQPLPNVSDPRASLALGLATEWASVSGEGAYRGGEAVLRRWDAAVGAGAFQLAVGREPVGYGYGHGGGIVFSNPDALPRVEVQTTRPIRLPWVLRGIGPVTVHSFAGPVNDPARHPTNPYLWGFRAAVQPHPRLTFAANRGSMFGGEGDPTTVGRVLKMLVGVVRSQFENQVISLEGRYRLPTERVLPATAYLEWGADDAAGAMDETPGQVAGLFFPALPGVPEVGAGVEYTHYKAACCGHGPWYQNTTFPGAWAVRGRPLAHPLGGEGAEYAAYAQADLAGARLHLDGRAYLRDRRAASLVVYGGGNLFTPDREGRATGGTLDAALRLRPRADLRAGFALESGEGWREQSFHAALAWLF
ncbi:MAG TPA: capsule assembly Wzi family protein [Longimicrobium sp.]|nr:capsule assembly Wzi family protein [Longimicrobium sp.]